MKTTTILHRVLEPVLRSLPPEAARQIVRAEADEDLQQRVQELAGRANEGILTPDEQREYEAYVDAGDIVATLQAGGPDTGEIVPLFNPRKQTWNDHFAYEGAEIIGLTATGRVTVEVLNMNEPRRLALRQELLENGELD